MADVREDVVQILSVEFDKTLENQSGESYTGCQVDYKNSEGKVQTKNMHNNTFQYNKSLKKELYAVVLGDYYKVISEKKGSFVNWKSIEHAEKPAEVEKKADSRPSTATAEDKAESRGTYKNTYETPEERAERRAFDVVKDSHIVRESSLGNAIAYVAATTKAGGDYIPSPEDVIEIAKVFEAFVLATGEPQDTVKLPE